MAASTAVASAKANREAMIEKVGDKKILGGKTIKEIEAERLAGADTAEVAPTGEEPVADPNTAADASGDMNAKLDEIHEAVVKKDDVKIPKGTPDFMRNVRNKLGKGGFGKKILGGIGSMFYKMPASGAKYKNSPVNKNFGDAKARGFDSPLDLKSFGVGSLKGGVSAKPRSKTGAGGKFNN